MGKKPEKKLVDVDTLQSLRDRATCANETVSYWRRCPGGRYIVAEWACVHCGHDWTVDGRCRGIPFDKMKYR